jgi:hypothetical protein
MGPSQGATSLQEPAFPDSYGGQRTYISPLLNQSSSSQDPVGFHVAPTNLYSSQARYGFPIAQNAQSGHGGSYRAPNLQSTLFGHQDQYGGPHSQHEVSGRPVALPQFNLPLSSDQDMQSVYPSQYSSAGDHVERPAFSYQPGGTNESSWQTEHRDQLGGSIRLMGSSGDQYYSSAQTGQNPSPQFAQQYSAPQGNVAPFEDKDLALASQISYAETPPTPAQDEMPNIEPATVGNRRPPIYQRSRGVRVDSSIIESESEKRTSYDDDLDRDVAVEVSNYKLAKQSRGQNPKGMQFYQSVARESRLIESSLPAKGTIQ